MLDLNLKGNELLAFAIVWGFSQDGQSYYNGGSSYLSRWLGITKDNCRAVLKRLEGKGVIEKHDVYMNGVRFCQYRATTPKTTVGTAETAFTTAKTGDSNYNSNNNSNNINNIESSARARFIKPSIEDIDNYCRERMNGINAKEFFYHYEANGWKVGPTPMKDWKAAIITWETKREKRSPSPTPSPKYKPHHTGVDKAVDVLKEIYAMDAAPDPNIYDLDDQSPF